MSSIFKDLPVAYHQQDDDDSCGPACAQMVIVSSPFNKIITTVLQTHRDESLGGGHIVLSDLISTAMNSAGLDLAPWTTDPAGMVGVLNALQTKRAFTILSDLDKMVASR